VDEDVLADYASGVEVADHEGLLGRSRKVIDQGQPVTERAELYAEYRKL